MVVNEYRHLTQRKWNATFPPRPHRGILSYVENGSIDSGMLDLSVANIPPSNIDRRQPDFTRLLQDVGRLIYALSDERVGPGLKLLLKSRLCFITFRPCQAFS